MAFRRVSRRFTTECEGIPLRGFWPTRPELHGRRHSDPFADLGRAGRRQDRVSDGRCSAHGPAFDGLPPTRRNVFGRQRDACRPGRRSGPRPSGRAGRHGYCQGGKQEGCRKRPVHRCSSRSVGAQKRALLHFCGVSGPRERGFTHRQSPTAPGTRQTEGLAAGILERPLVIINHLWS